VDKDGIGTHSNAQDAFECYRQYLIDQGFIPIGPRELIDPADGYVRVLTKKIRFGASVRRGKGAENGSAIGNRLADIDHGAPRIIIL
jgi:hypothetical protein